MSKRAVEAEDIREPAVAGLFYPDRPEVLREDLDKLYDLAGAQKPRGKVRGIIAPHAGYQYSGYTAACGYARLSGSRYDTVVVVSPSHREYFDGVSVYPGSAYRTPLGVVPVDTGLRDRLVAASPIVEASGKGHREEHAVEVHLPFLQRVLPPFRLLPLVVGHQSREINFRLGHDLAAALAGVDALLVASTDLSHYYPASVARRLDAVVIEDLEKFDPERLMDDIESGKAEACGGGPVIAVLTALKALGVKKLEVVHHCTSGDITGDTSSVVGYVAAVATDERVPAA